MKTHVQGEAADLLKSIQITDLNFSIAWKKLEDHYTNKRRLIAIYTKTLFDLPAIHSESPSQLQSLLNTTANTISALEQLKRPTNQWDDLLALLKNVDRRELESIKFQSILGLILDTNFQNSIRLLLIKTDRNRLNTIQI